jgi:Fe-Mn family superoxide dismutase
MTAPFSLDQLPYNKDFLSPYVSAQTLEFHWGKHHQAYVNNLNKLIEGTEFSNKSLEEIILATHKKDNYTAIFNNAAQVWNHTFLWHSMSKDKSASKDLLSKIDEAFGSYEQFTAAFKAAGLAQFGSGWVWLVLDRDSGKLKIEKTANAEDPLTTGNLVPLLTCDVWEHAYYLDYKNDRAAYLDAFINHLINWDFVEQNLQKIK